MYSSSCGRCLSSNTPRSSRSHKCTSQELRCSTPMTSASGMHASRDDSEISSIFATPNLCPGLPKLGYTDFEIPKL